MGYAFFQLDQNDVIKTPGEVLHSGIGQLFVDQPDAIGKEGGQSCDQLGLLLNHLLKVGPVDHQKFAVLVGIGAGGPCLVVQQSHLAKDVPGFEHGQKDFFVVDNLGDLDATFLNDVKLVARLSLGEDHGILGIGPVEFVSGGIEVSNLGIGFDLEHPLLGQGDIGTVGDILDVLIITVKGLVVLTLLQVVLGHLKKVVGILGLGTVFQS